MARAYTNLGAMAVVARDYAAADRVLREGIAYCTERDLDSWRLYMTGHLARSDLDQGRWDDAAAHATFVLGRPDAATPSRITPLTVVGRLRARRGDPDPFEPLDEALELALRTGEEQRVVAVRRPVPRHAGSPASPMRSRRDRGGARSGARAPRRLAGR